MADLQDSLTTEFTDIAFTKVEWYANRAKAAYDDETQIRDAFPNVTKVNTIAEINVQYFIERFPDLKRTVITIRGTDNLTNVRDDAEYFQSKNAKLGIYVHKGFDEDTFLIYQAILNDLDKTDEIILTGHSLGAAISTLLMMYLHEDGFTLGPSINFGQPKVTNKKGASAYEHLPLLRVVDKNDVVPLLPQITLLDSIHGIYEHLGAEIILLDGLYYVYLDTHKAMDRSVGSFWKNLGDESLIDHKMVNYLHNIRSKLNDATPVSYDDREQYIPHTDQPESQ